MFSIDEAIFVNQLAQGIVRDSVGDAWFQAQNVDDKRRLLLGLNVLILQASPLKEDVPLAISEAQLAPTLTPCVMIAKHDLKVQLAKLAWLPEPEIQRVFRLLIKLLAVSDNRRRREKPLDLINHWWHRDLSDKKVVDDIKRTKA
jgi:hypothetical protein